jgi:hypothetical protein
MDKVRELQHIAYTVQIGLAQLGLCYEVKQLGAAVPVMFRRLLIEDGDEWGLLEVDLANLPRGVTAGNLVKPSTVHHLGSVVGRPLYRLNTSGVTYAVDLRPAQIRRKVAQLPDLAEFDQADRPQPGYLGLGVTGQGELWIDPERLQNVLLTGSQGTGKSAFLRLLTFQMVKAGWRLALADPDMATFNPDLWRGAVCLAAGCVASSRQEVDALFALVLAEIERRSELFGNAPGYPDSLTEYNEWADEPLPRLALIVDEANTFFADKALVEKAADLARRARKWGLHCVYCGHNWRASDISRALSAMLQNRLAFRVNDDTSGKVVLERRGLAESLPDIPGRCWARWGGRHVLLQAYFLEKARLIALVEKLPKSDNPATWDDLARDDARGSPADVISKVTSEQLEQILALAGQDVKPTGIAKEVWGSKSGRRVKLVREILGVTGGEVSE